MKYLKRCLLMVLLILSYYGEAGAQRLPAGIAIDMTGGPALSRYTRDSLLPSERANRIGTGSDFYVNAYFLFPAKDSVFRFKLGLGYSVKVLFLDPRRPGDFLIDLYPFGTGTHETFLLKKATITSRYVNIPLGLSYRLARGKPKKVEVQLGLQLNQFIRVSKGAEVVFDSSYRIPTAEEKEAAEKEYGRTPETYTINLQPRVDLMVRLKGPLGLLANLQPVVFYLNSFNSRFVNRPRTVSFAFGLTYDLK